MNTISISGRVAQPQTRELSNGNKMLTFSIADDQFVKGEKKTQWFRCALFGKRAESLESLVVKGASVTVGGQLQVNEFDGNDGKMMNNNVVVNDIYVATSKPVEEAKENKSLLNKDYKIKVDKTFTADEIPF